MGVCITASRGRTDAGALGSCQERSWGRGDCFGRMGFTMQRTGVLGQVDLISHQTEGAMESMTTQDCRAGHIVKTCAHQRLIEDVLTGDGRRTGQVRCLECHLVIADPYRGLK